MAVKVVNMIPNWLSGETTRDSEPNITVDAENPARLVASVFTPDPGGSGNAPVYVSTNGGDTWDLNVILPGGNKTNDTSLRFAGPSGVLYAGIMRVDNGEINILRKADPMAAGLMDIMVHKTNDDQPFVEAAMVLAGPGTGNDRVYVGHNDGAAIGGKTATVHLSLDGATAPAPAGFGPHVVEPRATIGFDAPSIRPAVHLDGTVYAAYIGLRGGSAFGVVTADIVVARDDNWGSGGTPFTSLIDPGDLQAGKRVTPIAGVSIVGTGSGVLLGTQRIGSALAIAVDPRDSGTVYLAWADGNSAATYTIHLRMSTDSGLSWGVADLRTIVQATNPGLAVNRQGKVAFLYQQLVGGNRWQTHLERSGDRFASHSDLILADVPDNNGTYGGVNPIGDYANVVAAGKNFYGVFCGNNTPDMANFPNSVTYQRNADFGSHILKDTFNNPIGVSIDPYFFKITEVDPSDDFYVRDWTDSAVSGDNGAEPSTHPVFYATSDVWNRRGTLPGTFVNDQPPNEDAGNGAGNIGDNWAFCRIRRNAPAVAGSQTVTAHFLVSKFGTGSQYVDSSSGDPDVTFLDPDPTVVFNAADLGPVITTPVHWHLNAIAGNHLCLAVEISSPNDPFVAPSLLGNTPGWPTTDLRIVNDNNKAQRNMGLSTTPARGVGFSDSFFAIAHNAATFTRDMALRIEASPAAARLLGNAIIEIPGSDSRPFRPGEIVLLPRVLPGENRWVGLSFQPPSGKEGETVAINFSELAGGVVVNGFAICARLASIQDVIREKLARHGSAFGRIAAAFRIPGAAEESSAANDLLYKGKPDEAAYIDFLRKQQARASNVIEALLGSQGAAPDLFRVAQALKDLIAQLQGQEAGSMAIAHSNLLQRLDSYVTMRRLELGDVADILQNVRWTDDLYRRVPALARLKCSSGLRGECRRFIQDYGFRKVTNHQYPELIRELLGCFKETAGAFPAAPLQADIAQISAHTNDLAALQRAHRQFLLHLQGVTQTT
jgi:hypothetical protein